MADNRFVPVQTRDGVRYFDRENPGMRPVENPHLLLQIEPLVPGIQRSPGAFILFMLAICLVPLLGLGVLIFGLDVIGAIIYGHRL